MLLGPIFRAELLRTARRRRYYALRFFYGILLLTILWAGYDAATAGYVAVTIDQAARYALDTFVRFSIVQLIAILVLIPAFFGGAIADEKQRKTLHYLMASRLSSFEIVIDKLLGRTPHVLVLLALGLPVICLLGLVGGVPPDYVVVAYVGTISTVSMAVALTVLISTLARRVRQAVLVSYVLLLAWLIAPVIILAAGLSLYPVTYGWIEPINTAIGFTSPLYVYVMEMRRSRLFLVPGLTASMVEQFVWMVGLQLGSAVVMILLAVWRLRPAFRRHEATPPRRKWFEGRKPRARPAKPSRLWDRPDCGDDAMSWKERYFARTDIFTKLVVLPATIAISVVLVLRVGIDETILQAISRVWSMGLRGWGTDIQLVGQIRIVSAWYVAIWLLAVAGATASSVAVEREEDTWVSLTSTPLTGGEILRGKALGAVWAQRGFALIPLGLWTFGLVFGAIHPLGFLGALVAFGVVTWMVAAVGIHASLRSTTTSKAIAATIGRLAVLYGYPILWLRLFEGELFFNQYVSFLGYPPRLVVAPLMSYTDISKAWAIGIDYLIQPQSYLRLWGLMGLLVYACLAIGLTYRSFTRFDRWLDRPELATDAGATRRPAQVVEQAAPSLQS